MIRRIIPLYLRKSSSLNRVLTLTPRFMSTRVAKQGGTELKSRTQAFISNIDNELKLEEAALKEPVVPSGWKLTSHDNVISLTKKVEIETVTVTFDLFKTQKMSDEDLDMALDEELDDSCDFLSIPNEIVVSIAQEGKGRIEYNLNLTSDRYNFDDLDEDDIDEDDEEGDEKCDPESHSLKYDDEDPSTIKISDSLNAEIKSISFYGQDNKLVYAMDQGLMDDTFSENIVYFLNVRGVNGEFLKSITPICTYYESKAYSSYLKHMKEFFGGNK